MATEVTTLRAAQNVRLYPWFRFFHGLIFWQAIWFLFFQNTLSASEAILLYVIYDIATTALEVPSGYMSDRLGRKMTLVASALAGLAGSSLLYLGNSFDSFAVAQILLGASTAFASGTDSAVLYESLAAAGREDEVEQQELKSWRFAFSALALSSVTGGVMALYFERLPFLAGAVAFAGLLVITLRLSEPTHAETELPQGAEIARLGTLKEAFKQPVLIWIFCLSVLMYVFSHVLFVFGQPFILEALKGLGLEKEAPLVSGSVSSTMMIVSVVTSLFALRIRNRLGLPRLLLLAFAVQISLSATLSLTAAAPAIAVLFVRMVPNSLSQPFILARVQPLLHSQSRATYLSLQSFFGRLILASSLFLASRATTSTGQMSYPEIQMVLTGYALAGLVCITALALSARRLDIDGR